MDQQHLILCLLWIIFCVLHSIFAAGQVKRWFAKQFPIINRFYRLLYTLFAASTFIYVLFYQINLPSPLILPPFFGWLGFPLGITGLVIMGICIKKYFIGLTGLKSLFINKPFSHDLETNGIHGYVRHPLYLGTFLFIWGLFLLLPHLSLLLSNIIITVYTVAALRYEEAKLTVEFGASYNDYKKKVPALIPSLRKKGSNV